MNGSHFPRAKKRFGQHFLNDESVINHIISCISPRGSDHMIEIGPGPAVLTTHLAPAVKHLTLIEIDRDLAQTLNDTYAQDDHISLLNQDVLTVDWNTFSQETPWRVVGNLPYNISTPLIFQLLEAALPIRNMVFLLQKEVVDRLCAKPGSKQYGRLSVMTQYYCQAQCLFIVPPEAFTPPPKVMSALVALTPWQEPPHKALNKEHLSRLVIQAFSQRRKTISNSLKSMVTRDQLIEAAIDPMARAETLSVEQYVTLSNQLSGNTIA